MGLIYLSYAGVVNPPYPLYEKSPPFCGEDLFLNLELLLKN
jgi:hypothetical protein